jgi:integrase
MSKICNDYLHEVIGTSSTLHSLRHWYLTNVYRITKDPVFVRDLAGHADLSTTQVYIQSDVSDGINRLQGFSNYAENITTRRHLHAVPDAK